VLRRPVFSSPSTLNAIFDALKRQVGHPNKLVRVALSTLALNAALLLCSAEMSAHSVEHADAVMDLVAALLAQEPDHAEALFRAMKAAGLMVTSSSAPFAARARTRLGGVVAHLRPRWTRALLGDNGEECLTELLRILSD
jgi:hypothetical protein